MRRLSLFLAAALVVACSDEAPAPTAEPATIPTAAPAAPAPAPAVEQPGYVTAVTTLKREPNDEKKVNDAKTGKPVNNWLTTLQRGEQVVMLKQEGDYLQVRASDESVGWVKSDTVLSAEGVQLATVLEEVKTFSRPDFAALNAGKTLAPGSLLFVTKTKDPFSEVNPSGSTRIWALTEKLSADPSEIEASRLINRARWLEERKDPSAKEFWDLAKSKFGTTQLVQQLAQADAAAPSPTEGAAPTAPAAPN